MNSVVAEYGVAKAQVSPDDLPERLREQGERRSRIIAARMSPKGLLGLPKLLDERRLEYGITDGAFTRQAMYDRVFVWQIPMQKGETFEGSRIVMPESTQQRERNRAPHGIVVSAGLLALDSMRSNGCDLGHRVLFAHSAPYHVRYDVVEGQEFHLVILVAGDIIGSEDLATNLKERRVFISQNPAQADYPQHVLINEDRKPMLPQSAWRAED